MPEISEHKLDWKTRSVKALYEDYGQKLYGYAIKKWNLEEDEAWDLVYQTIYKVVQVFDQYKFENEKKLAGFVFKVFVNFLRNYYHLKKRHPKAIAWDDKHEKQSASTPESEEDHSLGKNKNLMYLQEELQNIEEWKRILLLMRAQNYSYEEISEFVNKPVDQLKVYYMRLKKQLIENMNQKINSK